MKKQPVSYLFPYRLEKIIGAKKVAHIAIRRPGEVLKSRDGKTRYAVQRSGAILKLA